jgi:hypothetical protein
MLTCIRYLKGVDELEPFDDAVKGLDDVVADLDLFLLTKMEVWNAKVTV